MSYSEARNHFEKARNNTTDPIFLWERRSTWDWWLAANPLEVSRGRLDLAGPLSGESISVAASSGTGWSSVVLRDGVKHRSCPVLVA
jgi:hypothetical protein